MTETVSKIPKSTTYKKAIINPVYKRRWRKVIEKELQNLEDHYTWKYQELPPGRKAIGSKWVTKVKYYLNQAVVKFKT